MSSRNQTKDIIVIERRASELEIEKPAAPSGLNSSVLSSIIHNAWLSCAVVDRRGMIWVSAEKLYIILRTTSANARYFLDTIGNEYKFENNGKIFVQGPEIIRRLDQIIQSAGSIKRGKYAGYSEESYRTIRDSKDAQLIRAEFYEYIKSHRHKLKQLRIAERGLVTDELTGVSLNKKRSEFSHVRSVSIYPYLADRVWNGLVVNKRTHKVITNNNITDEEKLHKLCLEQRWNTEWYDEFVNRLRAA